eukprot:9799919-Lingulodinium_polyedra.AAC.1
MSRGSRPRPCEAGPGPLGRHAGQRNGGHRELRSRRHGGSALRRRAACLASVGRQAAGRGAPVSPSSPAAPWAAPASSRGPQSN